MIIPYKDRTINYTKPVYIYRNLNKKGVWYSILQNGLVAAHCTSLKLINCIFLVNEVTRRKVLKYRKKLVHAYIKGTILEDYVYPPGDPCKVIYNPYEMDTFTNVYLDVPVKKSSTVILNKDGVWVW